jgi:hypothetical protein
MLRMADKPPENAATVARWVAWLHELDAWTEYWDIYHPETRGRYYFGDGHGEEGLLTCFLPREQRPTPFLAWKQLALTNEDGGSFAKEIRVPKVSSAVMEVDALVGRLFAKYFGDASTPQVQADYLEAIFRCATNTLPPATERDARIAPDDWRKSTAGRHIIDGDIMWFAWAIHCEAAHLIAGADGDYSRRTLQLAGVATGCSANFAWRGHRRTRPEYAPTDETAGLLRQRGLRWATNFAAVAQEVHVLFRLREWGHE